MKNQGFFADFVKQAYFVSVFFVSYTLFHNQLFNGYKSDLANHVNFIKDIIAGKLYIPHSLFHYVTYFTSRMFDLPITSAAVWVAASFSVLLSILVYKILIDSLLTKCTYLSLFLAFLVMYSGTFYLPQWSLTGYHYLGNGSISVWHNITLIVVKVFALLSFYLFFSGLEKNRSDYLFFSLLVAIISIYAKPSFIMVFLPTVFIYLLYVLLTGSGLRRSAAIYSLVLALVSGAVLYSMMVNTYGNNQESSIVFAPFQVWHLFSKKPFFSVFLANIFVFSFSILGFRWISLRAWFSLIMLTISIIIFALFAETGVRFKDANFSWSYCLSQQIAYLFMIIDFVNKYDQIKPWFKCFISLGLSLQLIGGLYYFYKIINGQSYM